MGLKKIDHIGIAVNDLEASASRWEELFSAKRSPIEKLKERGVELVKFVLDGGPAIELFSPLGENPPIVKFLKERGEGIHHICFSVEGLERMMGELRKKGIQFVQNRPQRGAGGSLIAFIHPRSVNGVLIELKEESPTES